LIEGTTLANTSIFRLEHEAPGAFHIKKFLRLRPLHLYTSLPTCPCLELSSIEPPTLFICLVGKGCLDLLPLQIPHLLPSSVFYIPPSIQINMSTSNLVNTQFEDSEDEDDNFNPQPADLSDNEDAEARIHNEAARRRVKEDDGSDEELPVTKKKSSADEGSGEEDDGDAEGEGEGEGEETAGGAHDAEDDEEEDEEEDDDEEEITVSVQTSLSQKSLSSGCLNFFMHREAE
jgi:transcription elongation factor SPT5